MSFWLTSRSWKGIWSREVNSESSVIKSPIFSLWKEKVFKSGQLRNDDWTVKVVLGIFDRDLSADLLEEVSPPVVPLEGPVNGGWQVPHWDSPRVDVCPHVGSAGRVKLPVLGTFQWYAGKISLCYGFMFIPLKKYILLFPPQTKAVSTSEGMPGNPSEMSLG